MSGSMPKIILVLTRCLKERTAMDAQMPKVHNLSKMLDFQIEFADCIPQLNNVEGRETGIILRWIINNCHNISTYHYNKVLFHHSHENSYHQKDLTGNLLKLFKTDYFWENEYGEIYNKYIEHSLQIINGISHVFFCNHDILQVLADLVKGT